MNKRIDVSLRSAAEWDSIGSVHELIFNNQSAAQRDRTMLLNKMFLYRSVTQLDCAGDSDIIYTENIG